MNYGWGTYSYNTARRSISEVTWPGLHPRSRRVLDAKLTACMFVAGREEAVSFRLTGSNKLNTRPRKRLGFRTPLEGYNALPNRTAADPR